MSHHVGIPDGFGRWVLKRQKFVVAIVAVITALAAYACFQVPIRTTILEGFMSDQSRFNAYRDRAKSFGGSSDDVIYVATKEGPELFTPEKLDAIRAAAWELMDMPEIAEVANLPDAPWIYERPLSAREIVGRNVARSSIIQGDPLPDASRYEPPMFWPDYPEDQEYVDMEELREAVLADPFIRGVLISDDAQTQAMVIQLKPDAKVEGLLQDTIRKRIDATMKKHGLGKDGIHTAGVLISQGWMVGEAIRSMAVLFPLGALVVSLLIQRVFGRLSLVALTMFISGIAVIWSVGATAAMFGEITIMVAAMPLLVLVIATADTVHLASAYVAEVEAGAERDEALRRTIRDVGGACILTSVTTGLGFLSLMVVPAATIRHASLAASVGVASALLLALTLVPIMLSWMPLKSRVEKKRHGWINHLVDKIVAGCEKTTAAHPKFVVVAHGVVVAACLIAATRIDADVDFHQRFPAGHPHRAAIDFFGEELMGANTLEVYVSLDPEELATTETMAALTRLERQIGELEHVESIVCLPSLLRSTAEVIRLPLEDGVPPTDTQTTGLLTMASQAESATNSLLLPDHSTTRLLVRVAPTRLFKMLEVTEQIEQKGRTLPTGMTMEVSGMYPIVGRAATAIIDNQLKGFVLCFFSVMTVVALGLRSVRLSLLAVFPNVLPLTLLAGAMGVLASYVDTDALGIAVISFGLAVDDTIHFLHRYDIELAKAGDVKRAIHNTYHYTGQAIVRTTLILGVGMMPFALSGYLSIQMLGTYLVLVLFCAILGDLLLLPAMILWMAKGHKAESTDVAPAVTEPAANGADAA